MRRNSDTESGRVNPRFAAAAVLCLAGTGLAMLSFAGPAAQAPVAGNATQGPTVIPSEFRSDVRSLPQQITPAERKEFIRPLELEAPPFGPKQLLPGAASFQAPSPTLAGPLAPMPTPITSFDGMNFTANGAGYPPDTVGDVGPNHFVQAVNTSVGIYEKATHATLATFTFGALWGGAGTGTACDTFHGGDPTVIY